MATSAFGNLGMQNLGTENYTSGEGLDLGRALLAMGISKSGLEGKLNDFGLSAKNGKLGFGGPAPTATPVGAAVPTQAAPAPGGLSTNDAVKTLMNTHDEPTSSIQPANEQQALAFNSSMPPPVPIMGGVVPPDNEYMNGPGLRDRIAKYAMGAFA
jgi:hypothetical protein